MLNKSQINGLLDYIQGTNFYDYVFFGSHYADVIKELKLPHTRFHDLRHGHATLLLQNRIHPKIVTERLGHSSMIITMDTYSHVLPNMQKEAAQKLDNFLFNQTKKTPLSTLAK
ncbi:Phage integrase family protein [Seinonella peptonophila]|uniref:Phage integrase family protein n=1 Tax=Seinonella peptonophila TaxID=112248 RepID=A0A1M5ACZ2_9BACL|nr:tyrosine-type recombinase/integrase [Seinonella peptonophila]SHF28148.1 Phage integrase family protein [Seinonella peptonophila]